MLRGQLIAVNPYVKLIPIQGRARPKYKIKPRPGVTRGRRFALPNVEGCFPFGISIFQHNVSILDTKLD